MGFYEVQIGWGMPASPSNVFNAVSRYDNFYHTTLYGAVLEALRHIWSSRKRIKEIKEALDDKINYETNYCEDADPVFLYIGPRMHGFTVMHKGIKIACRPIGTEDRRQVASGIANKFKEDLAARRSA